MMPAPRRSPHSISHLLTHSPEGTWSPESMTLEVTFACKTQADRERLKTALADW